ncbi:MAG: hypothetical protein VST64_05100, partial [Nitrospirota bacterium]|nr:hypothetical protein [Nitrospirota bacterium]
QGGRRASRNPQNPWTGDVRCLRWKRHDRCRWVRPRFHACMDPELDKLIRQALADALAAGRDYLSQTEEAIQVRLARPRMTALGALSAVNRVRRLDRDRGN